MFSRTTYSRKEFIFAVKISSNVSQVLMKLGLCPTGGSHRTINEKIKKLDLDTFHFKKTTKGRRFGYKHPLKSYLVKDKLTSSHNLKLRLIKEEIFQRKCYTCNNTVWNGKPIPIELDHINGDHYDNRLENLKILCPNCHAQTETHRGKNTKHKRPRLIKQFKNGLIKEIIDTGNYCTSCLCVISIKAKKCKSCVAKTRPTKIDWPVVSKLLEMVKSNGYLKTGRILGISDNAIRKHIKNHSDNQTPSITARIGIEPILAD